MSIRAVLFDLDCTLTDRRASVAAAAGLFARKYSIPAHCGVDRLKRAMWNADHWGYRDRREFFEEVIREIDWKTPTDMGELLRFWAEDHPTCTQAHGDVYDTLRTLRRMAIRTAIVTNGEVATQSAKIRQLRLEDEVDVVVISDAIGIRKPAREIFTHAIRELGVDAAHSLFVGDHPINDILGAQSAGMRTAWIPGTSPYPAGQSPPWMTIRSLSEILPAIRGSERGMAATTASRW